MLLVRGLLLSSLLISTTLFPIFSEAQTAPKKKRTWSNPEYQNDPYKNTAHIFGEYSAVKGYSDPEFTNALDVSSPLTDLRFDSYDVAVIISMKNSKDSINSAAIKGQTIRVYARDSVLSNIGLDRFAKTKYDATTGLLFYWKTSTAREGKNTPRGYFRPQGFSSNHFSSLYNDSPMPWALFFNGSIATHGVLGTAISHLGTQASAGCARLEPQRAEDLFNLIGLTGRGWVDKIDQGGNIAHLPDGTIEQEVNWKTLISVR